MSTSPVSYLVLHPTHSAESSKRHRDVVRQKIAEYLQHAEELYQTYLLHKEGGGDGGKGVGGGGGGGELSATVCQVFRLTIVAFSQSFFFLTQAMNILSDNCYVQVCSYDPHIQAPLQPVYEAM